MKTFKPLLNEAGEVRELTKKDFASMKPLKEVMPPDFINMVLTHQEEMVNQGKVSRVRGKQKLPTKQMVSIRLSTEVINALKTKGKGCRFIGSFNNSP